MSFTPAMTPRRVRWRRWLLTVGVVAALSACGTDADLTAAPDTAAPAQDDQAAKGGAKGSGKGSARGSGKSVPVGDRAAMGCVEEYSLTTLSGRAFALDGTVESIGGKPEKGPPDDPYVEVTLTVNEWFKGGGPQTIVIAMMAPGWDPSVGEPFFAKGARLLVSGEARWGGDPLGSPVAWLCGFTRTYSHQVAGDWRTTLAR